MDIIGIVSSFIIGFIASLIAGYIFEKRREHYPIFTVSPFRPFPSLIWQESAIAVSILEELA